MQRIRLLALAILLLCPWPALADVYGLAVVLQGDSLKVGNRQVRLFGIDAPPVTMKCSIEGRTWNCGREAKQVLVELVEGQRLRCTNEDSDRWGRILATCYLQSGKDVGAEMVRAGYAIAFTLVSDRYVSLEARARRDRVGIWAGTFPPTWQWSDAPRGYR